MKERFIKWYDMYSKTVHSGWWWEVRVWQTLMSSQKVYNGSREKIQSTHDKFPYPRRFILYTHTRCCFVNV